MTVFHTITHVQIGFANPFLVCSTCGDRVPYWHDPDRCGCEDTFFNYPCKHKAEVVSRCPTWNPVYGCICEDGCKVPQ